MWISFKQHLVEEREFKLLTKNCSSGSVILQLIRHDARVSFFLFPKKITKLICKDTGKPIKKSYWTTEIKETAEELKKNLNVPMWGYWSFGIIALAVVLTVSIGFYSEIQSNESYQDSFMAQNDQEKRVILEKLNAGDLIATMKKVYKIEVVDDKKVILVESKNPIPESLIGGLNTEAYPKISFTGPKVEVSKSVFMNGLITNSEMIVDILDN